MANNFSEKERNVTGAIFILAFGAFVVYVFLCATGIIKAE
jgi:hypothetical protein